MASVPEEGKYPLKQVVDTELEFIVAYLQQGLILFMLVYQCFDKARVNASSGSGKLSVVTRS